MSDRHVNRYAAYKESGVEWLGEVPEHWKLTRNKEIFYERGELSESGAETLLTVSHITGVTPRSEKNVNMFMAETMVGYKHCRKGDLILNTMWAWMGALGTAKEDGICSPAYGVYAPRAFMPYNHAYFDYLYRTPKAVTEITRNSKGIVSSRLRLYPKDFFQILTALPSFAEQTAIAAYLDTKTAQIDLQVELFSKKAMQYGKLKQSLINEIVTRGLDGTVPMKESGVEWIGEVPAHWEVKRVKGFVNFKKGKTPNDFSDDPQHLPYLSMEFLREKNSTVNYVIHQKNLVVIADGELLVLWDGANAGEILIGKKGYLSSTMAVIKAKASFLNKSFFFFFLKSLEKRFKDFSNGTTIPHFAPDVLTGEIFGIPPLPEQTAIASYLDTKTAQIDRIVSTINTQIDKLKELRKTLINDVVTGKIKVIPEGELA
jgi:type I restriction enzyme, S subunit